MDGGSGVSRIRSGMNGKSAGHSALGRRRWPDLTLLLGARSGARPLRSRSEGWARANLTIESEDPTGRFTLSIVVRFPPSNMTRQQYDTVRNALTEAGDWPADGCQLHVLFGDENDLLVSEVWESREKLEAFGEKLRPRIEEAGIQLAEEPQVLEAQIFETF